MSRFKSALKTIIILMGAFALMSAAPYSKHGRKPASTPSRIDRRIAHAKELLGKTYARSAVKEIEKTQNIEDHIKRLVTQSLKGKWKLQAAKITKTVLAESKKYGFDPVFLMAVIQNESSFIPDQVGSVGEIGLMQLRPNTAKWVAKKMNLKWSGDKTLYNPVQNIRIGAAYLSMLREQFDQHSRLYLSAYNMGPKNVTLSLEKAVWPKEYVERVMSRYIKFYREVRKANNSAEF